MNDYDRMCGDEWADHTDEPRSIRHPICPFGCGMPDDDCVCDFSRKEFQPQPYKTLTQQVREAEASVTKEDLLPGETMEDWQHIRQWPEDGEE